MEEALTDAVRDQYDVELDVIVHKRPPKRSLGDAAFPVAFDLARKAKIAPRKIAEALAPALSAVDGVDHVEVAGAGYLNVFFDRQSFLESFLAGVETESASGGKVVVEHTNINPNKAAHIGHLRNAALGDTFVRALRYRGELVEVQNYIDDTGVQVADVVVGFLHLENKSLEDVKAIANAERFDYVCWDLYARMSDFYAEDRDRVRLREDTLKAIEENVVVGFLHLENKSLEDVKAIEAVRLRMLGSLRTHVRLLRDRVRLREDTLKAIGLRRKVPSVLSSRRRSSAATSRPWSASTSATTSCHGRATFFDCIFGSARSNY